MKLGILGHCFLAIVATSSAVSADDWTTGLIEAEKIDFGVIATGSEARREIPVRNIYNETLHISSVSTTCGCSAATTGETTIEPGGTAMVEVKMNTRKFKQKKNSNLIVRFDAPRYGEIRIPIAAYIRTDVVFDPGMIRFGNVDLGEESTSVVEIRYAGRNDWDIEDVKIDSKLLAAELIPGPRSSGRIDYRLSVTLDRSAPAGRIRDLITIVTNDRTNPYVPLMVEGVVVPDITVTPSIVNLRNVRAGGTATARIVVKGKNPFRIENIDCEGMSDCFKATISPDENNVHVVPIQFNAPSDAGRFEEELIIQIAGRTEPLRLRVNGIIN